MIKAVIFDVDGVLLDSFKANFIFFQDLFTKAGYAPPTREEFPALFHLSMRDVIQGRLQGVSEEEIERVYTMGRDRDIAYPVELLVMPPHAKETIEALSKQYRLGIVTSRIRESVYEAPALAALQSFFQVAVSYDDTTNHKPHPEPLLLAAQKLGVNPDESVYIGDVANDVFAARAAGMKVVIYSKDTFPEADACTALFDRLPEIVDSLHS